jgi:hypothetical protein
MKNKILAVVLSLVAIMSVQNVMAWGGWGHHISTYIAEKHLTPEAKEKCQHYLKHRLPHYSSWQDYWRHSDPFKDITYWHSSYINKKKKVVGHKGIITREATYQIERIVKEMENGKYHNLSDSLVAVNLKLLIHMVPDMHCPSHIVHSKEYGLKGHSLLVKGKKFNRHKVWDSSPQLLHPKWKADRFVKAYDTYSEKEIKKIVKGTPTKWTIQNSKKMIATYSYWEKGDEFTKLSKEQRQKMDDIVHEQLAYGGYRLANILNMIFSK